MYFLNNLWASACMIATIALRIRNIESQHRHIIATIKQEPEYMDVSMIPANAEMVDVAIVFIDIVSFSVIAEKIQSESMFHIISKRLISLRTVIEQHGGQVDRSLGDGLLCYFASGSLNQTVRALRAAQAIQSMIVEETTRNSDDKLENVVLPLRIGIHSDQVVIGNMGGRQRVDFTMVGKGVNFANFLEQACSPFRVMLSSQAVADLLQHGYDQTQFSAIKIPIKHSCDLVLAYDFDPLFNRQLELLQARQLHADQNYYEKSNFRYLVDPKAGIELSSTYGHFRVNDISLSGFKAVSSQPVARHAVFEVAIDTGDDELNQSLADKLVNAVTIEVRWCRRVAKGPEDESEQLFEHGFKILGDGAEQAHFRLSVLITHPGLVVRRSQLA